MADIQGKTLGTSTPLPKVNYKISYDATRPSNTQMKYEFTIGCSLGSSGSYLGTGYAILATLTVNGKAASVQLKTNSDVWSGTTVRSKKVTVICTSTTHPANLSFKFQTKSNGNISDKSGILSNSSYTVATKALLTTKAGAPTTFTATPSIFENVVNLSWEGAKVGTNNNITSYYIDKSENGGSSWNFVKTVSSTATKASTQHTSYTPARGTSVKYRIRTQGSAGASYYSAWKESGTVKRNSAPLPPTVFQTSKTAFHENEPLVLTWSGASDPDNKIKGYRIKQRKTVDGEWSEWENLTIVLTEATDGTFDVYSNVNNGEAIQYGIETIDHFDIASTLKTSDIITREDFTGLKVYTEGEWAKVTPYVFIDGQWKEAKAFYRENGQWKPGKD